MFKPTATRIFNHIIQQNNWAKPELQAFGGKSASFNIFPFSTTLTILEDGALAIAGEAPQVDASVTISPSTLVRLLTNDEGAYQQIKVEGDTELATALAKVLRNISWDFEEDLSKVIGDAPAYQVGEFGRKVVAETKSQAINLAEMLAEYLQEERESIAKKRHVEQFIRDVDILREDAERVEKRVQKLSALLKTEEN